MSTPTSSSPVLGAFPASIAPSAASTPSTSALHSTASMMEDEAPFAATCASSSPLLSVDGASPSAVAAEMEDAALPVSPAIESLHSRTQSTVPQGASLAQPATAAAAASASGSSRKRAFIDDDDGEVPLSDQPSLFAVDDAGQPLSSDHLSKKARASQREGAVPSAAAASSSSFHSAEAASMAPDSMAEEPVSSAAATSVAALSSALTPPSEAASSSLNSAAWMIDEPASSAAAATSATAAAPSPAASAFTSLAAAASMSDVDHRSAAASSSSASGSVPPSALPTSSAPVDSWSDREKLRRAREDNDADRAALLMESGKLNELQTCFQLANDRLGLPYIPTDLLRIIAAYAERLADEAPSLVAIVVSTIECSTLETRHELMQFTSEAEFRAYVKRVIIDETRLIECLGECKAAWEVAQAEFTSTLPVQIEWLQSQIDSALESHESLQRLRSQLQQLEDDVQTEQRQHRMSVAAVCLRSFAQRHPLICSVLKHDQQDDLEAVAAWLAEDSIFERLPCFPHAGNKQATVVELWNELHTFLVHQRTDWTADVELEEIEMPAEEWVTAPVDPATASSDSSSSAPRTMLDYFPRQPSPAEEWSEQQLKERTRAINNADRAALLSRSGRLNELQTCFQLGHDRLGLPLLPPRILDLISDYASFIPVPPRVLCVAFSLVRRVPFAHRLLRFESEADFRAHVHRVMIEETHFAEYVIAREAAQPPDFVQLARMANDLNDALSGASDDHSGALSRITSSDLLERLLRVFAFELGNEGTAALAEWEAAFFNQFVAQHPRILGVLNAKLIREASLNPQGSVLSRVKAVGSLDTPLSEVAIAFQHFLQFSDANSVSSRFCIVHETD